MSYLNDVVGKRCKGESIMKRRPFIASMIALPFAGKISLAESLADAQKNPAFAPGEKLTYSLGWQFIVAGRAVTEVLADTEINGAKVRNFRMTARTRSVVDQIYKVRDSMTSSTDYEISRALEYRKLQREGDEHRNETILFDWERLEANYHEELGGKKRTIPVIENTLDPLSAFYFVRNQTFDVGSVIKGPLTDGKKCKIAELKVVGRETIKVNGTKYDTFKLLPDIKDVGGVFKKEKGAKIEIWCTADERHIPVLLKSKVMVGSFKAELESIEKA